ncbi:hypothetical protein JCM8097_006407 [Rhodosporidiobolus ruineniae]
MPTHSPSRPPLTPLAIPSSSSASAASPLRSATTPNDERRPLLRSVSSFNATTLKRKSARVSTYLFNHAQLPPGGGNEPLPFSPLDPPARTTYDSDFRRDWEDEGGTGVRTWYDNFHGIDWLHDAVKHQARLRRIRRRLHTDGLRGRLVNLWDGAQGWVLVTLIGVATACIAFGVIRSEMVLFDLKEGYCTTGWTTAKRFCCRTALGTALEKQKEETPLGGFMLRGWAAVQEGPPGETCPSWRTWAQVWEAWTGEGEGAGETFEFTAFAVIAIAFSTLASLLTLTFTASTSVCSSKDSPSVPHAGISPAFAESLASSSSRSDNEDGGKYGAVGGLSSNGAAVQGVTEEVPLKQRPRKTLYFAAGSGLPEIKTILSGFVIRGYLGSWTLVVKAVGLALSVGSGLSLGKEGPFVHLASCVANILSRFFKKYDLNEAKRREVISAACAAGVAVSFGAPVGGVLFSLEEVSYFFPPRTMLRSFWCAMVAAMSLKLLDPFRSGKIVLFEVTYDRDWHALELVGFLGLAVFGGVYGAVFCRANIAWTRAVRGAGSFLGRHPIVEVALVTLLTTLVSFWTPWTRMGGTELISALFSECHSSERLSGLCVSSPSAAWPLIRSILLALLIKAALTVVTFGIKLPAGIFIPTLAVGACAGRVAGLLVEVANERWPENAVFGAVCVPRSGEGGPLPFGQACVLPGVWAMIGAASTLAGVTRTTVSLAVIVFELTGTLTYSVPTMAAVLLAKTVADSIEPRSIYDLVIELADLPYLDAKTEYIHESTPSDILDADAPTISLDADNTVASLRAQLAALYASGSASGFPLVALTRDEPSAVGRRLYGYIASKELEHGLALAAARGLPDSAPLTFRAASAAAKGVPVSGMASRARSGAVTPLLSAAGEEGMDLGWLTDSAPIVVNVRSPMELVHEMFIKLGIRYVIVVDERGIYLGSLDKLRYLRYCQWLEKRAEHPGEHKTGRERRLDLERTLSRDASEAR